MSEKQVNLSGSVTVKLSKNGITNLKKHVKHLKGKHRMFSMADFLEMCANAPLSVLEPLAFDHVAKRQKVTGTVLPPNLSDEAKAKIEAILAEEAAKK
ncbi:hypothetical protein QZJ86_00670 [Methylomonas montana]|uniref:hypothetical protein n=1 Tax=Methylomonas montana TaxID=3058963 RepID=UPI002659263A|nr:hypothetical protein [Methylomonas montana]WKJ90679.1 hypothetical protein QZJ86_00670 [Methylomonas montana]